jgi:hypothetical protein
MTDDVTQPEDLAYGPENDRRAKLRAAVYAVAGGLLAGRLWIWLDATVPTISVGPEALDLFWAPAEGAAVLSCLMVYISVRRSQQSIVRIDETGGEE